MMNVLWLVAAIVASIVVIALALWLSRSLANEIGRAVRSSSVTPSQTLLLARLIMLGLALIVSQALLRRPIAQILGGEPGEVPIEAGIAAAALAVVLVLLVWAYQAARPMLQTVTLRAIDAAIPTTGEVLVAEPTRTSLSIVNEGPVPSATDAVTVVAQRAIRPTADAATVVAGHAAAPDADATVVDNGRRQDVTVASTRPEDQATVVTSRPDDPTLRIGEG